MCKYVALLEHFHVLGSFAAAGGGGGGGVDVGEGGLKQWVVWAAS